MSKKIKVRFLIEMKVEEIIEVTSEEFDELQEMDDDDKHEFFWDKAVRYGIETTNIEYTKVSDEHI